VVPFEWASLADLWLSAREGKSTEEALRLADRELHALATKGPSEAELEKVKNRVELGFLGGMETAAGKAEQIGLGALVTGDPCHAFVRLDELRAVSAADVRRVVRAYLVDPPRARIDVQPSRGRA
jgi:zinc protease